MTTKTSLRHIYEEYCAAKDIKASEQGFAAFCAGREYLAAQIASCFNISVSRRECSVFLSKLDKASE